MSPEEIYRECHSDVVQNPAVLEDDRVSLDNWIRCFEGNVIFRNVGNQLSSDARHISEELSPQVIEQQQSAQTFRNFFLPDFSLLAARTSGQIASEKSVHYLGAELINL